MAFTVERPYQPADKTVQAPPASGHVIVCGRGIVPIGDDARHIIGGEVITIVPLHTLADIHGQTASLKGARASVRSS